MELSLISMRLGNYCQPWILKTDVLHRTQSLIYVTGNGYSRIEGYYNNLNQASFFLKALGLNGAKANDSDFYAGMYFGSSFECEVTDINGTNVLRKGISCPLNYRYLNYYIKI